MATLQKAILSMLRKISGTMAAKKTYDLIPYCHPIPIDSVKVDVSLEEDQIKVTVQVKSVWKTGVEMEALTARLYSIIDYLRYAETHR